LHWPHDEPKPTKAWLSNLPAETEIEALVALGRLRWRVERDYREGKGLVGLDHYEGRTWHGIHHHAALVTLSQQFLACERLDAIRRNESREDAEPLSAAFSP
jgi:SRSO17 transposase